MKILLAGVLVFGAFSRIAFAGHEPGDVKKDCAADVEKLCRIPEPAKAAATHPGPRGCLRENREKLSPGCKAHFDASDAAPAKVKSDLKEETPSTSLERESSDLAEALSNARAIPVGVPLSPSERTRTLAWMAISRGYKAPVGVALKSGDVATAPEAEAESVSTKNDGNSSQSL